MDFKGYFMTGDCARCNPFTITDAHSRYLIRCQIVSRMDLSQVRAICEAAMREYGVPARIRTDKGAPFAGTGLFGLSKLSLGWMKMGIVHERIQPGKPHQNGRHERLHRTLKEDTANPPVATCGCSKGSSIGFGTYSTMSASRRLEQRDARPPVSTQHQDISPVYSGIRLSKRIRPAPGQQQW